MKSEASVKWQSGFGFPGTKTGEVINAKVIANENSSKPSKSTVRKPKGHLKIQAYEKDPKAQAVLEQCDAGDSFYFIFPNSDLEVGIMVDRLGVSPESATKDIIFSSYDENTDCDSSLPAYVPNPCSLNYILRWCLDIRRSPSRQLLRALAEHTKEPKEQRRLLELCSVQGSEEFTKFVRMSGISLVDLLLDFPSCQPPISLLIEMVPRLLPRAYTIACHKSEWGWVLRFVYSLLEVVPAENGIQFPRYGACSGWLRTLEVGDTVQIVLKEPSKFRLPPLFNPKRPPVEDITNLPLMMVGPGTGVAPFIAFLEKIRSELKAFVEEGVLTNLVLCESRPLPDEHNSPRFKYVQNGLKAMGEQICEYMLRAEISEEEDSLAGGLLFACGDVKAMSKSLWSCLSEILQEHQGYTPAQAMDLLKELRVEERLIEDVWS